MYLIKMEGFNMCNGEKKLRETEKAMQGLCEAVKTGGLKEDNVKGFWERIDQLSKELNEIKEELRKHQ